MKFCLRTLLAVMLTVLLSCQSAKPPVITGELKKWHKITLTFEGPRASEQGDPNPFLDYRMDVTFRKGQHAFTVPGYFAADGNAANSSANEGNKWRVHFCPDEEGEWTFTALFRKGKEAALSYEPESIPSGKYFDSYQGTFTVGPTDKNGRDFRGTGRLEYYNQRYLRFAETGDYFLKAGADSPENLLACADFDGEFKNDGHKDSLIKDWGPHMMDWSEGDPTWQNGKGKGIIGALNYLSAQGMNAVSFLTLNIGGDDQNVFPYTSYDERLRFDVSRLDQWETVLEHADKLGLFLHFKTQESENQGLLDGGNLGTQRRLYYRMLLARFSHHLALNWNLGEENGQWKPIEKHETPPQSTEQRLDMAQYFYENDPYAHPIVIHNGAPFDDLLTPGSKYTGISMQYMFNEGHARTLSWRQKAEKKGITWVVCLDEQNPADDGVITDAESSDDHAGVRKGTLWGTLMAGGMGVEYYFGYKHPQSDLTCQDWRSRERMWAQSRFALEFFGKLALQEMECQDELCSNTQCYCLCKPDQYYVVYLPEGGTTQLDLSRASGSFSERWFNPRIGQYIGAEKIIKGGGKVVIGPPPNEPRSDWAVLLQKSDVGEKS